MAAAAGHELDADGLVLAEEIASETDGNPFFVGEVLRSLVESGRLLYDEATRAVERRPLRTARVAGERARRDRPPRRAARRRDARAADARGRDRPLVRARAPRAAGGATESELLDRLEAAVDARRCWTSRAERVGRFRFVHALINQTLYEGLGATRRSSMHHRVALALEELYGQSRTSVSRSWRCTGGWPASRQAEGGSLLGARRAARARQPRAGGGGEAVRRRARPARPGRGRRALPRR